MALAAAQVPVLPVCDLCGSSEEVNWFCQDCQESLCNRCKIAHQGGRKTKNDDIVPIAEVKGQTTTKVVPVLCQEHRTKVCELYCEKCEQLICSQCLDKKHKSHKFYSVDKLIESKKSELDSFKKHLNTKLSSFENVISKKSQQHFDFMLHVEKLTVDIKNETDKIIQEFTQTRDKHISDLNQLKNRAEEEYRTACNHYQTKASDIRKTVDDIEGANRSGNAEIMMKMVSEIKQKITSIEVPTVSTPLLPNFQHNACHPPSILQLDIPNMEAVSGQKLATMSISRPGSIATKPTLDMNSVKINVNIQVQGKSGQIRAIIPTDNNALWVVVYPDHHLTLLDTKGCTLKTSADVGGEVYDAVPYFSDILCTIYAGHCVMRIGKDGALVTKFSDLYPFYTLGLCVAENMDILLSVLSSLERYDDIQGKVIRLNSRGEITQEIKDNKNKPVFSRPAALTSLDNGYVAVVDWVSNDVHRLICTDRLGNHMYTWTGQIGQRKLQKFFLSRATHDKSVYITDKNNHCVYVLDRNGKAEVFMLQDTHQIEKPVAITIDNKGQLWLGCHGAKLYMLK